jgi:hypothetical protein
MTVDPSMDAGSVRPVARNRARTSGRPYRLHVRLTSDELQDIEAAAARAGLRPTGYAGEAAVATRRSPARCRSSRWPDSTTTTCTSSCAATARSGTSRVLSCRPGRSGPAPTSSPPACCWPAVPASNASSAARSPRPTPRRRCGQGDRRVHQHRRPARPDRGGPRRTVADQAAATRRPAGRARPGGCCRRRPAGAPAGRLPRGSASRPSAIANATPSSAA